MANKRFFVYLLIIGGMLYGQENLQENTMSTGEYARLSDTEKVEYVKQCFRDGINMQWVFTGQFARAGGIGIIPWLLEELPKYEFYYLYDDVYDERLSFIFSVLAIYRDKNLLTMWERYYIAGILEAKLTDYVKRYKRIDLLVMGMNSQIWMFLNSNYYGQLAYELEGIIPAKYRAMGLLD